MTPVGVILLDPIPSVRIMDNFSSNMYGTWTILVIYLHFIGVCNSVSYVSIPSHDKIYFAGMLHDS